MERDEDIVHDEGFKKTGSEKAGQLAPSSPYGDGPGNTQAGAAAQSADNDEDRVADIQQSLQNDADAAQHTGNLSFPEGKQT